MSEFKHVTDVNCKKGLMSSRVEVVLKSGTALPSELVQQIALAVDNLVSGRQLILSGEDILLHTTVDIGFHQHSGSNSDVVVSRALQITQENLAAANCKIAELTKEVADTRKDARALQEIIDGAANGIMRLQWASTKNKEARERFLKRHRNG